MAARIKRIPTGYIAEAEDQARAVLFLADADNASANGVMPNVDGGTVALSSGYASNVS